MYISRKIDRECEKIIENNDAILIYGFFKSGKSTLLRNALKKRKEKIIILTAKESAYEKNLLAFAEKADRLVSVEKASSLFSLFSLFNEREEKTIFVIEEIENIRKQEEEIKRMLKERGENTKIILTTASLDFYNDLSSSRHLDKCIALPAFEYSESEAFYSKLNSKDKLIFYSVFGSLPYVNMLINEEESLKKNIRNIFINKSSPVHPYMLYEITKNIGKRSYAYDILSELGSEYKTYSDLLPSLYQENNGLLDKQLSVLLDEGLIEKINPINKIGNRKSRYYCIKDGAVAFYYSYIYPYLDEISELSEKEFFELHVERELSIFTDRMISRALNSYFKRTYMADESGIFDDDGIIFNSSFFKNGEYTLTFIRTNDGKMTSEEAEGIKCTHKKAFFSLNGFDFNAFDVELLSPKDLYKERI